MCRTVLVIALMATSNAVAADFSGRWAGSLETNGNPVPIYLTLNESDGNISGSVVTGSRMPIYFAPNESDARTGASVVTGSVPAAIEKGEVHNGELSFEVQDNAHQLMQVRLTLTNGVLRGEATVGGQVSKVAVVQIGGGGSGGRVGSGVGTSFSVTGPPTAGGAIGSGAAVGGGVFRVGGGVSAPILIHKVEPEYTEEARAAKYQGTVALYVEIGPDGTATNIRVQRSLGLGLDEKAIECVKQWKFKPGEKDEKPVTVAATIEVNFRL